MGRGANVGQFIERGFLSLFHIDVYTNLRYDDITGITSGGYIELTCGILGEIQ
jgi:hypothetical protein